MRQDDSYLLDMLVAARRATRFALALTFDEFRRSDLHQSATLRVLEIIGEAASRISSDFKREHAEIPWSEIIGLRNRIAHAYFAIDVDLVWQIVNDDIPALIDHLERLVPPEAP